MQEQKEDGVVTEAEEEEDGEQEEEEEEEAAADGEQVRAMWRCCFETGDSVRACVRLSVCLCSPLVRAQPVYLSDCKSTNQSISLSSCLFVDLSICRSVNQSIHPSM